MISKLVNALTLGRLKWGWYSMPSATPDSPIVIGGCSRSGTTLLYSILNAHSRLFIGLETALFKCNRDLPHISQRTGMPLEAVERHYRASHCSADFTERLLTDLMAKAGKSRWGDKSPANIKIIPDLFHRFPNARFVHCIRDGRDVVCSLHTHPPAFLKGTKNNDGTIIPWDQCIERWRSHVQMGIALRHDRRYYEIKYEDLIREPERTLRNLLQWLEEPWAPNILNNARFNRVETHPGVSKPINASAFGRWNTDLPIEVRKLFHGDAQNLLVSLGYAENQDWIETMGALPGDRADTPFRGSLDTPFSEGGQAAGDTRGAAVGVRQSS